MQLYFDLLYVLSRFKYMGGICSSHVAATLPRHYVSLTCHRTNNRDHQNCRASCYLVERFGKDNVHPAPWQRTLRQIAMWGDHLPLGRIMFDSNLINTLTALWYWKNMWILTKLSSDPEWFLVQIMHAFSTQCNTSHTIVTSCCTRGWVQYTPSHDVHYWAKSWVFKLYLNHVPEWIHHSSLSNRGRSHSILCLRWLVPSPLITNRLFPQ